MPFKTRLEYVVYQIGRFFLWLYLRVGHGLVATGLERVPKVGAGIVAGNHPSLLDPAMILVTCPRPVRFMAAEFLFKIPFLRRWLAGAGMIRVDRKKGGAAAFREALASLERGELVGIFPHGELVKEYEKITPKDGAVQLSVRANVPIIPCYTAGSEQALGRKRIIPKVFIFQCAIAYGEPYLTGLTRADLRDSAKVAAATLELMRRINELKGTAKNLTQAAGYRPIAPFEHLLRSADAHPEIWESQARTL